MPLLSYPIRTAIKSRHNPDIWVSSEDEEIINIARKLGAKILRRDTGLADEYVNLDLVVADAYRRICSESNSSYDVVVTLLPTSPTLKTETLDRAIDIILSNPEIDTVISARKLPYLLWRQAEGGPAPLFEKRMSRQAIDPILRESGAFVISRSSNFAHNNRVHGKVHLYELDNGEELDIDSQEDWSACEFFLTRKRLLFVVCGSAELGLGHVFRALTIANDLPIYDIQFLTPPGHDAAVSKIHENGYAVEQLTEGDWAAQVLARRPDMVINDILNTHFSYMETLKAAGVRVINFEDLGSGALVADATINAIYDENLVDTLPRVYSGHRFFCARDEFVLSEPQATRPEISRVLITFGGGDENDLTGKVLSVVEPVCAANNIGITAVVGSAYRHDLTLQSHADVHFVRDSRRMSELLLAADIIFTGAGGTAFEIACLGVPAIVLAQNSRELTHRFPCEQNGFVHLGLGTAASPESILAAFDSLRTSLATRVHNSTRMLALDVRSGKRNVIDVIKRTMRT
jgi:spore coat polysaccharide biosynthesis predicted glycosyltransferase SpsG/CMP-N-acetylneuraminic acid synthetase